MRLPSLLRSQEQDIDSMMTPMIDVVFLLLVFFVWTTSVQLTEFLLPSQVSANLGNQPSDPVDVTPEDDFEKMVIQLQWDGADVSWKINRVTFADLEQVQVQLQALADIQVEAPVIIHPEKLVPMEHVIDVYDATRLAGFTQVSLAVETTPGGRP